MKYLLLITLSLISLGSGFAQKRDSTKTAPPTDQATPNNRRTSFETYQAINQIVGAGPYTMAKTIDDRYEGLHGTPYFLPEWNKGQIEMASGKNYQNVPIKFDAYRQNLLLLRPNMGNDSIIVAADQVKSFQLSNSEGQFYLFRRFPTAQINDKALKDGYFMVLYQGKSALLKRIAKTFKQADYKNAYSPDIRYDSFNNAISYYILKPDQSLTKVKLSDKAIIEGLGDHKDELKAFAKQETLSGKTEDDAIRLVKQYDSF
jgi:hypothetical protein